jgi:hypothetical protein
MKKLIKIIFILAIVVVAYFVFAKTTHISLFKSKYKLEENSQQQELSHDAFLKNLPKLENTNRYGGGNVIMYYDTLQHKTILQSCYFNKVNSIQIDKDHFQSIIKNTTGSNYFFQTPFPFENFDEKSKKFGSCLFDRGFYLGIYRELIENISIWQQKYGNLSVSFSLTEDPETRNEYVLVYIKSMVDGKTTDIAYLIPNKKSFKHIYDYMIIDKLRLKKQQLVLLNALNYTYPEYKTAINTWKIHSKKYELRNLRWNFD